MYPLLLEFIGSPEKDENTVLYVIKNIGETVVRNGEYNGFEVKEALQIFGKQAFGEDGINTSFFRSKNTVEDLISRVETKLKPAEYGDETVIYPFGVVDNIITDDEITADNLKLNGRAGLFEEKSFMLVFSKTNDFLLTDFDSTMRINKGFAVFVPAKTRVEINGEAEIILIHL